MAPPPRNCSQHPHPARGRAESCATTRPLADALRWQEYRDGCRLASGSAVLDAHGCVPEWKGLLLGGTEGGLDLGALLVVVGGRRARTAVLQRVAGTVGRTHRTVVLAPLEHADDVRVGCATRAAGLQSGDLHRSDDPELLRRVHQGQETGRLVVGGADDEADTFLSATVRAGELPRLLVLDDADLCPRQVLDGLPGSPVDGAELPRGLRRFARRYSVTTIVGLGRTTFQREPETWTDAADQVCRLDCAEG